MTRVMLTAGEIAVLSEYWPAYPWQRGLVTISPDGLRKIKHKRATLEKRCRRDTGTKKFNPKEAYHSEMLSRVIEKASRPAPESAGEPEQEDE